MNHASEIVLWGASTRAASWSTARAGWIAHAWDLFADCDFPDGSSVQKLDDLTCDSLQRRLALHSSSDIKLPFLPTGGWENTEGLCEWIACKYRLFGCDAQSMAKARNPFFWAAALDQAELPRLVMRSSEQKRSEGGNGTSSPVDDRSVDVSAAGGSAVDRWIRKSFRSIGGLGVRLVADASQPEAGFYDQQFQPGVSCSALCVTVAGETDVAGTSLQLTRHADAGHPFLYAGNAWPLHQFAEVDAAAVNQQATRYATVLAEACELSGLWGFDFVWRNAQLWVTEINPRYTAAAELFELSNGESILKAAGWSGPGLGESPTLHSHPPCLLKQVVYAERPFVLPADWDWQLLSGASQQEEGVGRSGLWNVPAFSDLPHPGTAFRPGEPVCTIWGAGESAAECRRMGQQRLSQLRRQLPAS